MRTLVDTHYCGGFLVALCRGLATMLYVLVVFTNIVDKHYCGGLYA